MRVVFKFAVAFFAAALLCLSLFSTLLAEHEASRLERALGAGLTGYGSGLRPTVEEAWQERGYAAAERIAERFAPDREVRVTLRRTHAPFADGAVVRDGAVLRASYLVRGPGEERARLDLERPIASVASIVRAELGDQLLAVFLLAIAMGALATALGAFVIGRPLGRIAAQARRIGAGDLSQRLRTTGTDEIGTLKRELNAMCDRLAEAKARIEEESAARTEALQTMRHLDRLRTVGTIASSVAHELGTPLNVVLLRAQTLRGSAALELAEVQQAGATIVNQVQAMSRIVRQLLDYSRKGAPAQDGTEIALGDVARHATSLLSTMAKKYGVTLVVEERDPAMIVGDFQQIEQALTNIIVNGLQAMKDGGTLTVRVTEPHAAERCVEIRDEGEGMTEEVRAQIFEPFFTTKASGEGTGLGLHVARGIIEEHGGTMSVESAPGRGTTFHVRFTVRS